jgi:hypothetical protein
VIEGSISYKSIQANPEDLNNLVNQIETIRLSNFDEEGQLVAFWINTYNILVIKSVVDNYPINSPLEVPGFFDSIQHLVGGELLTLDEIEKEILLMEYKDPRFHFVLVCAAKGCPEIIDRAYFPDNLEEDLDMRTREVVNDPSYVNPDYENRRIYLNEIFKWYKSEFESEDASVLDYINNYRTTEIPKDFIISYFDYNWRLNDFVELPEEKLSLQEYTPSVLLKDGQFEIKIFNNLYTQTEYFNDDGERVDLNSRSTFFTSLISGLYGISSLLNIGGELWIRSVRNDDKSSSPFEVLKFSGPPEGRTLITRLGPKIKISPFKTKILSSLSIQSTWLFPVNSDLSGVYDTSGTIVEPYIDDDAHIWLNQLLYDLRINQKFLLFTELSGWFRFDRSFNGNNSYQFPLKLFFNYFPNHFLSLYLTNEFSYTFQGSNDSFYAQAGIGLKYQLVDWLELEGLLTTFYTGFSSGAGNTFNLGLRMINF